MLQVRALLLGVAFTVAVACGNDARAAAFCVADEAALAAALEVAKSNNEDDIIRIVEGAALSLQPITPETGFSLRFESGWNADCSGQVAPPASSAQDAPSPAIDPDSVAPQRSTTPAEPPQAVQERDSRTSRDGAMLTPGGGATTLLGVPNYLWRHGCGPTAVGMLLGYHDMRGYADLFEGSAATQTEAVQQGIASQGGAGNPGHYEDYSEPRDSSPTLMADKSEAPAGDEHASNSIADFMETSFSSRSNFYGWSWSSDIDDSVLEYSAHRNNNYSANIRFWHTGGLSFNTLKQEIDANRPLILLVDTDGDGYTDHFVPAIGYNESTNEYACWDTWYNAVRWEPFRQIQNGNAWGIWGMWAVEMAGGASNGIMVPLYEIISD